MVGVCCAVSSKILLYLVLICYQMVDLVFDWYTFAVLLRDNKFSGVSISKSEENMIRILFGLSCVTGTIFSFVMIVAYKYYMKYHRYCLKSARYDRVNYSDDNVWFSPDHARGKKCNRMYINLELWISVLELFLKDIIQSVILFWAYVSKSSATSNPASMSIVFSVCSIAAHLKLCLCFLTKLCGWGTGEERCGEHTVMKALSCIYGFEGSAICLILTAVAFSIEVN